MKKWFNDIFYSFPIQLLILHLRNNLLLIFTWILLALLMTGKVASIFGISYLFLTPEYLGEVNFLSFFFLGLAFGGFFMTWNLTTYLLDSHHFPFLASLSRPFTKFCLNNLHVPQGFLILYLTCTIRFQHYAEYWTAGKIATHCLGFLTGALVLVLLSGLYFWFTNKDILSVLQIGKEEAQQLLGNLTPKRGQKQQQALKSRRRGWRVDTYLTLSLRPRLVRSVAHYDTSVLLSVFKQNHVNALVAQLGGLILLIILGFLIDNPYFRIPAGASIFILGSVIVAVSGAIVYWFDQWSITVILLILVGINYLTEYELFNHQNKGYGLDYTGERPVYSYPELSKLIAPENIAEDKTATMGILENWSAKFPAADKPKMVVFCVSGGGMKAAVWAMKVMQTADSLLRGELFPRTMLITGASGGLIGASYLRELYLQEQLGRLTNPRDPQYIEVISQDLLNSVAFTIVSNDIFLPWATFEEGGFEYHKDRGYIFEQQLNENTNGILNKKIKDYQQAEAEALIPMLFVTPSIVNDGRRLIISPHGVSYMTIPPIGYERPGAVELDAVDFGRFFVEQGAYNMRFTTALRMNATYPYVLPNVHLPSQPSIEIMDAGFRDNYGIASATRFVHVFKDWILNNTSGVVLVQITSLNKIEKISPDENKGLVSTLLNPLGIPGQILSLQDYEQDTNLGYIYDLLGKDNFDVVRFIYQPSNADERASVTFHLTRREKRDILQSLGHEDNRESLDALYELVMPASKRTFKGYKE